MCTFASHDSFNHITATSRVIAIARNYIGIKIIVGKKNYVLRTRCRYIDECCKTLIPKYSASSIHLVSDVEKVIRTVTNVHVYGVRICLRVGTFILLCF